MDATSGRLVWSGGERKHSGLFIELLKKLLQEYPDKKIVHVILDNFKIHSSKQVQAWLAEHGQRLRLHFLPPYCPDDNRIERCVWRELHANVTRNHECADIDELLGEVEHHLKELFPKAVDGHDRSSDDSPHKETRGLHRPLA